MNRRTRHAYPWRGSLLLLCAAAGAAACLPAAAAGAEFTWTGAVGNFGDEGSWKPAGGPPGPDDAAVFTGDATVDFACDPENAALRIPVGDVALMLNGHTYSLADVIDVGAWPGATARLEVEGGTLRGGWAVLAPAQAAAAFVTVDGADSALRTTSDLYVGDFGSAELTVSGGGQVSSGDGHMGSQWGASGTVTVAGAGSTWANSGELEVGSSGTGELTVSGGAEVFNTVGRLGWFADGSGIVTVDGDGSTWRNSGELYVGQEGGGELTVSGGGRVFSQTGSVGRDATASGTVTVAGPGSRWVNSSWLVVGEEGAGELIVSGGGEVTNALAANVGSGHPERYADATGTVTVDGDGSKWTNTGELNVGYYGTGSLTVTAGGEVSCAAGRLGLFGEGHGTATVDGPGSKWTTSSGLAVGVEARGELTVSGGGQVVTIGEGTIAENEEATGIVAVDGDGSAWSCTGMLRVGGGFHPGGFHPGGAGVLTVRNGGAVSAAGLLVGHGGTTVTVDGGRLSVGSLTGPADAVLLITDPAGGDAALTIGESGDLDFDGRIIDGAGGAGSVRKVGAGTLTLDAQSIHWTGGTYVDEGVLSLPAGLFVPGGAVTVGVGGELRVTNVVNRALAGSGKVTAVGPLVIGDMTSTAGWDLAGTLNVGGSNVLLLDADVAQLGEATTLAAGGKLDSFNGARLGPADHADPTQMLSAAGGATIDGDFRNNGAVTGPGGEEWLTFTDDVCGAGSFSGNVRFRGLYSPGNSIACVSLENVAFDASAILWLEIGPQAWDFLDASGELVAGGVLEVVLIDGFQPRRGEAFDLLDWGGLSGVFGAVKLPDLAPGLAWDDSALYTTGEIAVIPEPATLLFLSAAAALPIASRPKRRRRGCLQA